MKIKTSEATNIQLDWLVTKCEVSASGVNPGYLAVEAFNLNWDELSYSFDWAQGGPIIDSADIDTFNTATDLGFKAVIVPDHEHPEIYFQQYGSTRLVAAMRCYVVSKLGDEVEVPDELS